jgi:hypothetical protein
MAKSFHWTHFSFLFVLLSAIPASAQRGWYMGANAGYDQLVYDEKNDRLVGSTYDLDFGFNFSDSFGLFSTIGGSFYDGGKSKRGSIDLGPRFILHQGAKFQPYLDLQATASTVDNGAFNFSRNGFGGTGSVGVHYFINDAIALNGVGSASRVYYNDVKFAGLPVDGLEQVGTYYRIRVGIAFYFR